MKKAITISSDFKAADKAIYYFKIEHKILWMAQYKHDINGFYSYIPFFPQPPFCRNLFPVLLVSRGGDQTRRRYLFNPPPPRDGLLFKTDSMPLVSPTLSRGWGGGGFN